jgi:hypothetical protein
MVQEHGLYSCFIIKELTSNIEPIYSFLVLYDKGLIEIAYFYNNQSEKSFEPQRTDFSQSTSSLVPISDG